MLININMDQLSGSSGLMDIPLGWGCFVRQFGGNDFGNIEHLKLLCAINHRFCTFEHREAVRAAGGNL